jgi:hypothetical protein
MVTVSWDFTERWGNDRRPSYSSLETLYRVTLAFTTSWTMAHFVTAPWYLLNTPDRVLYLPEAILSLLLSVNILACRTWV